jgi:hypothetical protein
MDRNCYSVATKVVSLPIRSQIRYYKTLFSPYFINETTSVAYRYDSLFSTLYEESAYRMVRTVVREVRTGNNPIPPTRLLTKIINH